MSGGTGRRRKPPVGEEGGGEQGGQSGQYPTQPQSSATSAYDEQQQAQQPPESQYPQYQTYAQPAEPQYDYDWRQTPAQAPGYQPPAAYDPPAYEPPPQPAYSPPPQYEQYQGGQGQGQGQPYQPPATDPSPQGYSAAPRVPQQQPWDQPAAASAASPVVEPAAPAGRSRPRPEPRPEAEPPSPSAASASAPAPFEFEFEFDPDDEQADAAPAAVPPESAASADDSAAPSTGRPSDKDGYRPNDFAFVDQADEPDVKGWLSFSESRADSRAERVRKLRFRLIALAVVLVLVGAGVGVYKWLGGGASGAAGEAGATKSTILFRLDDTAGNSVGDALMVTKRDGSTTGGASGDGAIVIIPAQMQIDSEGFGDEPFGGDMASDEPPGGADEVASALGVTPDGVWTMDETTFGIFVDELGGLALTTNAAVPASTADPKGVPEGTGTLTGVQAVAYATYEGSGEAATAQAVRFGQVLNALMAKMPTYNDSVEAYLNQLGLIPDPSLPLSKLSPILAALAAQQQGNRVTVATLPLTTGNSLNDTAAAKIVSTLLGGTAKAGASAGQAARVLVQNGTGASTSTSGKLTAVAQGKLTDAGYTYNAGDVVATQAKTEVEVASTADQSLAEQVAASLGLSGATVQVVSNLASVDDVTVVLGQDWSSLSAE
jgi:LytR cell envelope-related transcriptional attenuator